MSIKAGQYVNDIGWSNGSTSLDEVKMNDISNSIVEAQRLYIVEVNLIGDDSIYSSITKNGFVFGGSILKITNGSEEYTIEVPQYTKNNMTNRTNGNQNITLYFSLQQFGTTFTISITPNRTGATQIEKTINIVENNYFYKVEMKNN